MAIHIFDVDDTLIRTTAQVIVRDAKGNVVGRMGSKEFNRLQHTESVLELSYRLQEGCTFDFSEFESLRQILSEPTTGIMENLKHLDPHYNIIYIITARQRRGMLWDWLHEVAPNADVQFANIRCYDRDSGMTVAEWKASEVRGIFERDMVDRTDAVYIYEDDPANSKAMYDEAPTRLSVTMIEP